MKNKVLRVFLTLIVTLPMFTSVFAVSASDLLDKLDGIVSDIEYVTEEYKEVVEEYPDVISALSAASQQTSKDVEAGKLLSDEIDSRIELLKAELLVSTVDGADDVLDAVVGVEKAFDDIIEDNKDVIEEVENGYSDLTVSEIQQVVKKSVEVLELLGKDTDVSDTYSDMLAILEAAHEIAKDINVKLEAIIASNVSTFEAALSKELIKGILTEVKSKDQEAIIDTLIEALNNANGGAKLKADLKDVKSDAKALKNKLIQLNNLSEQDLLMFTDNQRSAVSKKIKAVEKDYVDFAKVILDNYLEDYMDVVIDLAYDETVDKMIEYANEALDYYAEYKETVDSLSKSMFISKLPKELAEKAALMVALGFVDVTDYNKEYITNNFQTQIDNISKYIAEELINYLDYIGTTINKEVMDVYQNGVESEKTQIDLRAITKARFNTLAKLKSLKSRVDKELLKDKEEVKSDLSQIADYVYTVYNENIMLSMAATLVKENVDPKAKYECADMDSYIVTNKFMATNTFTEEFGLPDEHKNVVTYKNAVKNKVKTGTSLTIKLSETTMGSISFVVLGDIYADGMIDARDYMVIKNYIMENEQVSKLSLLAADTYRDKVVDSRDYMVIKNYIMDGTEISL